MEIRQRPLSYVDRLDARDPAEITTVVIHATELPDLATARVYGERICHAESGTGNSGHFYIDTDGTVEEWVPAERIAHHVRDHNAYTLGIELVHAGRWPEWFHSHQQDWSARYPQAQIAALVELLKSLPERLPSLCRITGHDRLDTARVPASDDPQKTVRRKLDPGPTFPWARVLESVKLKFDPGG